VHCGGQVETGSKWFCEAAWAGDYERGDFDRTDIVAGTGGRWRDEGVYFVSSGSTVDRLHSLERGDEVLVSNSLPCLLAAAGASLRPSYPRYSRDLHTVVEGLRAYQRFLATSAGPVRLTYFDNLVWDGRALEEVAKPGGHEDFRDFQRYHEFLLACMGGMVDNAAAPARRFPYAVLGTLSSGYDSATVATIARQFGCREVICFDKARLGKSDSGEPIARILGLEPLVVDSESWRSIPLVEVPFVAGCDIGESVYASAEPHLGRRLFLTGQHGDAVWDIGTTDLSADIRRIARSGLALTEYRLWTGFLHCAVPFWGARQLRDIHGISVSAEMLPWRLSRPTYNRPICRRIVEGAGVPRDMFGTEKKAVGHIISQEFLSPTSSRDYLEWVGRHRWDWLRHGRVPPVRNLRFDRWVNTYTDFLRRVVVSVRVRCRVLPLVGDVVSRGLRRLELSLRPVAAIDARNLRRYVFPWAVERAKAKYLSGGEARPDSSPTPSLELAGHPSVS
jgi:hypothetical protein